MGHANQMLAKRLQGVIVDLTGYAPVLPILLTAFSVGSGRDPKLYVALLRHACLWVK